MQDKSLVQLKRAAKAKGGYHIEAESKLMFVIRIRGLNKIHPQVRVAVCACTLSLSSPLSLPLLTLPPPHCHTHSQVKKILQLLRLRQINNGTFLRVSVLLCVLLSFPSLCCSLLAPTTPMAACAELLV